MPYFFKRLMMFVHCPLHMISIARKVSLQLCLYTVVSISRSHCAGQKHRKIWSRHAKQNWMLRGGKMPLCLSGRHLWRLKRKNWRYELFGSVCRVLASMPHWSWFISNAVFDYVHPYVHGFFGCFGQKPLSTSSRSRCVTMFRLVVLRARIAREIAVTNSDVEKTSVLTWNSHVQLVTE